MLNLHGQEEAPGAFAALLTALHTAPLREVGLPELRSEAAARSAQLALDAAPWLRTVTVTVHTVLTDFTGSLRHPTAKITVHRNGWPPSELFGDECLELQSGQAHVSLSSFELTRMLYTMPTLERELGPEGTSVWQAALCGLATAPLGHRVEVPTAAALELFTAEWTRWPDVGQQLLEQRSALGATVTLWRRRSP
jgi:hypothetical protein